MTSVALITAVTLSPFFRPSSSALLSVITDSTILSPTFHGDERGDGPENYFGDFALQMVASAERHRKFLLA